MYQQAFKQNRDILKSSFRVSGTLIITVFELNFCDGSHATLTCHHCGAMTLEVLTVFFKKDIGGPAIGGLQLKNN